MKNIKRLLASNVKLILFLIVIFLLSVTVNGQTDISRFEHLKQPQISTKEDQKMIVVETKGDPNIVGGKAFGLLFQLYFTSPETPKGFIQLLPRARWPEAFNSIPKTEWIGLYALPVPDNMSTLPPYTPQEGINAKLETWQYGEVAEILHLGPYSREDSTMNLLKEYVNKEGYEIVGGHEEEYLVGPTGSSKGDPEKYVTIIRYRVQKIK